MPLSLYMIQSIKKLLIEKSIDGGIAYLIIFDNKKVVGIVIRVKENCGELELLFTIPDMIFVFISMKLLAHLLDKL